MKAYQPDYWPTRKLSAATIAMMAVSALMEILGGAFGEQYPYFFGPAVTIFIEAGAAFVVGYFVADRANVPVE